MNPADLGLYCLQNRIPKNISRRGWENFKFVILTNYGLTLIADNLCK